MASVQAFIPQGTAGFGLYVSSLSGLAEISRDFNRFIREMEEEVLPDVMVEALEPTLSLAQVYCPVATGELRASGYVEARRKTAEVGFARGGIPDYAVFVHENPKFYHEPPTQAKFLQRAMDEDYFNVLGRIVAGVKSRSRL